MGKHPEYISPWADYQPSDPVERERANEAFWRLTDRFLINPQEAAATIEGKIEVTRRFHSIIEGYFALSVRAAAEGIPEGDRARFISNGMAEQGLIDSSDPAKTAEEYAIVSQGYELNRFYWDRQLGRMRRVRNDLKDMPDRMAGDF